jgi:hypothetical protein
VNTGKARQSEADRLFVTLADGIDQQLQLEKLENHFGMRLMPTTNEPEIAPKVNAAIVEKQDENQTIDMAKVLLSLLTGDVKIIPMSDNRAVIHGIRFAQ